MTDKQYLSCADTAKLIRKALKHAFPGIKFSVRSDTYSGGASIRVRWTDGPTTKQVEAVARPYGGASFDGMIDLKSYHDSYVNAAGEVVDPDAPGAQRVHFGADYVFCDRDVSENFAAVCEAAWRTLGEDGQYQLMREIHDLWAAVNSPYYSDHPERALAGFVAVDAQGRTDIATA